MAAGRHSLALVAIERLDSDRITQACCQRHGLIDALGHAALGYRNAALFEQGLGQLLISGNAYRNVRSVTRERRLQALLATAPTQLEQVGFFGQAQRRDTAGAGGANDGSGTGADGAAPGRRGKFALALLQVR